MRSPRPLELTASDEYVAIDNIEILRTNGFDISVEPDDEDGQRGGERVKLVAQPVSKDVVFDMKGMATTRLTHPQSVC